MKHCCSLSFKQGVRRFSALFACMLFTFVFVVSPIRVKATAYPVPPLWLPINPYNAQGLEDNFVLLSDDQKKIVNEVIGAVNIVQLGMGSYVLLNPISGVSATRQFYQEYGSTFLNTFWSQIMGTSRAMTDFVGSTIYKASTYDSYEDYEVDTSPSVDSANHKYFQISPELTVAFKNWYRANGGVEDWQIQVKPFSADFTYKSYPMSAVLAESYNLRKNSMLLPVRYNRNPSSSSFNYYNGLVDFGFVSDYSNLFINTSNNTYGFVNSFGNTYLSSVLTMQLCIYGNQYNPYQVNYGDYNVYFMNYGFTAFNASQFNTYVELVRYIYNNAIVGRDQIFLEDFVQHVYVGADWSSRHEIFNIDDLNIGSSPSEYIDNISDTGFVDINSLIGQIADEVVNLRDVVEESVLVKDNDSVIPYADSLQVAIDKYINQPESGVVIPSDLFGDLTGVSGPVSYLWFMTKPLVSYTGDLLGLLTLDGDGTFQFTGLGYIVVGVVTVGIIGGIITKCLL